MTPTRTRVHWPILLLLPGLLAMLVALSTQAQAAQGPLWAWCAAHWWQLLFFGALLYYPVVLLGWGWRAWAHRASTRSRR